MCKLGRHLILGCGMPDAGASKIKRAAPVRNRTVVCPVANYFLSSASAASTSSE
jgi:hypothetical protein